jgi:hypothetical protein
LPSIVDAVMPAPRAPVELREFPEPTLAPGSVLPRTLYSEVCGTDVHTWHILGLNLALADPEAMRLPKALVKPH